MISASLFPNMGLSLRELMIISVKDIKKVDPDSLSINDRKVILLAIRTIASYCDGAQTLDGQGFSKLDKDFGLSLATQDTISPRQAAAGALMIWKYRRQLPESIVEVLGRILTGKGKRVDPADSVSRFKIIPEFYKGQCVVVNILSLPEWRGIYAFEPKKYDNSIEKELLKIGLKDVDIREIHGIVQIEANKGSKQDG
jgi:hypothetical protein